MTLGVDLRGAFGIKLLTSDSELGRECSHALRCCFKVKAKLAALSAEAFQLLRGNGGLLVEPQAFAPKRRNVFLGLRNAVSHG